LTFPFACSVVAPVSNVSLSDITITSIKVSWTHAPGDKDGYTVHCIGQGGTAENVTKDVNSVDCVGLTPGTEYSVTVTTFVGDDNTADAGPVDGTTCRLYSVWSQLWIEPKHLFLWAGNIMLSGYGGFHPNLFFLHSLVWSSIPCSWIWSHRKTARLLAFVV
jgi:hypothetical protein